MKTQAIKAVFTVIASIATLIASAAVDAIPAGYTRLEWLASTNDAPYIDTGYTPNQTDKITVRFRPLTDKGNYEALYCARGNGGGNLSCIRYDVSGGLRFDYNGGTQGYTPGIISRNTEYVLVADGNIAAGNTTTNQYEAYALNGNVQTLTLTADRSGAFTIKNPLRLFATDTGTLPGRFRIYYFRVENSAGVAQVDLRPCRRNSDGKLGMYDLVRETFCPAGGTGEFETNDIGVPSGYYAHEWIQSDGNQCQWINTQFKPLCTYVVSTRFQFRSLPDENLAVFCARDDGQKTFSCIRLSDNKLRFDHNKGKSTVISEIHPIVRTDYTVTMNGTTLVGTVSGGGESDEKHFNDAGRFDVGSPFFLFAAVSGAYNSVSPSLTMHSSLRLYSFTVTDSDSGVVLCDLLPCTRVSDDKHGLYDRINKRFLTNGGSGEFAVPRGMMLIVF